MPMSSVGQSQRTLFHTGIGGAGNYRRISYNELAPSPRSVEVWTEPRPFFGGRGGAGNAHAATERAIFSFDEELARDRKIRQHAAPIYSVGRGGMGNMNAEDGRSEKSDDMPGYLITTRRISIGNASSRLSTNSIASNADKLVQRIKGYGR